MLASRSPACFITFHSLSILYLCQDSDGSRREEISGMSAGFGTFYEQLAAIRAYHAKHSLPPHTEPYEKELLSEILESGEQVDFTGEEAEGRYLDMHELHELYLNLKGVEHVDYSTYLKAAANLQSIPKQTAVTGAYGRYLRALNDYWLGFIRRTQPLMPLDELLEKATTSFDERWSKGEVTRWQASSSGEDNGDGAPSDTPIPLGDVGTAVELEAYGLERLKNELARLGLKCGGSLAQRAERLFLLKSMPLDQIPKQHRAKPPSGGATDVVLSLIHI